MNEQSGVYGTRLSLPSAISLIQSFMHQCLQIDISTDEELNAHNSSHNNNAIEGLKKASLKLYGECKREASDL